MAFDLDPKEIAIPFADFENGRQALAHMPDYERLLRKTADDKVFLDEAERRENEYLDKLDKLQRQLDHDKAFHEGFVTAMQLVLMQGRP